MVSSVRFLKNIKIAKENLNNRKDKGIKSRKIHVLKTKKQFAELKEFEETQKKLEEEKKMKLLEMERLKQEEEDKNDPSIARFRNLEFV